MIAQPAGVLMLSAVGTRLGGLDTSEEQRQVTQIVRGSRFRDGLTLHTAQAVQGEDILGHLLDHDPTVLHFSGHAGETGLRFLAPDGGDTPLVTKGLAALLGSAGKSIRLVVLNACDTDDTARELAQTTGCAIGHPGKLDDQTAITFATNFYRCISTGMAVGPAYASATAVTQMYGAENLAVLHHVPEVDPDRLHILHPSYLVPPAERGTVPNPTAFLARQAGAKRFTALITGETNSEAHLRSTISTSGMETQWIQIEDTTRQ